jgi:Family of unknown function (DUF6335)
MARKKPAKKAKKKSAGKAAAAKTSMKKAAKKPAKKTARKKASKPAKRAVAKKKAAPTSARASAKKPKKSAAPKKRAAPTTAAHRAAAKFATAKKPNLDRPRKTVADIHGIPSSLDANRSASAAKSGRADMQDRLSKNTSASPALTSGDVDADWESADAVGDEAPGGDNPTPDQDVVDDIGRALGVEYDDDEELQGGAEITDRDRHRWELDPASKDDDEDTE